MSAPPATTPSRSVQKGIATRLGSSGGRHGSSPRDLAAALASARTSRVGIADDNARLPAKTPRGGTPTGASLDQTFPFPQEAPGDQAPTLPAPTLPPLAEVSSSAISTPPDPLPASKEGSADYGIRPRGDCDACPGAVAGSGKASRALSSRLRDGSLRGSPSERPLTERSERPRERPPKGRPVAASQVNPGLATCRDRPASAGAASSSIRPFSARTNSVSAASHSPDERSQIVLPALANGGASGGLKADAIYSKRSTSFADATSGLGGEPQDSNSAPPSESRPHTSPGAGKCADFMLPAPTLDITRAKAVLKFLGAGASPGAASAAFAKNAIDSPAFAVHKPPRRVQPRAEKAQMDDTMAILWNTNLHDPFDGQFFYARAKSHPYDLQPLESGTTPEKDCDWVVVGARTITYCNVDPYGSVKPEGVSVGDWMDERSLFLKIREIPWFRDFWKTRMLASWKQGVSRSSFERASGLLEENLLWLQPSSFTALRWIFDFCFNELESLCVLEADGGGRQLLPRLMKAHSQGCARVMDMVREGDEKLQTQLRLFCWEAMAPYKAKEELVLKQALAAVEAALQGQLHHKPWMPATYEPTAAEAALGFPKALTPGMRARLQRECERVWRLVRLCTFRLQAFLRSVVRKDVLRLNCALAALECPGSSEGKKLSPGEWRKQTTKRQQSSRSQVVSAQGKPQERLSLFGVPQRQPTSRSLADQKRQNRGLADIVLEVQVVFSSKLEFDAPAELKRPEHICLSPSRSEVLTWVREATHAGMRAVQSIRMPTHSAHLHLYLEVGTALCTGEEGADHGILWPCFDFTQELMLDEECAGTTRSALARIGDAYLRADEQVARYQELVSEYYRCQTIGRRDILSCQDLVSEMEAGMSKLANCVDNIEALSASLQLGFISLDCSKLRTALLQSAQQELELLGRRLPAEVSLGSEVLGTWVKASLALLRSAFSETVLEFIIFMDAVHRVEAAFPEQKRRQAQLQCLAKISVTHGIELGRSLLYRLEDLQESTDALERELEASGVMVEASAREFAEKLDADRPKLLARIASFIEELMTPALVTLQSDECGTLAPEDTSPSRAMLLEQGTPGGQELCLSFGGDEQEEHCVLEKLLEMEGLEEQYKVLAVAVQEFSHQQELLKVVNDLCVVQLRVAQTQLQQVCELWTYAKRWHSDIQCWAVAELKDLDVDLVNAECAELMVLLDRLPGSCLCLELQGRCLIMQALLETLDILRSRLIKEHHWMQFRQNLKAEDAEKLTAVKLVLKGEAPQEVEVPSELGLDLCSDDSGDAWQEFAHGSEAALDRNLGMPSVSQRRRRTSRVGDAFDGPLHLPDLVDLGFLRLREKLLEIFRRAQHEEALEVQLLQLKRDWQHTTLKLKSTLGIVGNSGLGDALQGSASMAKRPIFTRSNARNLQDDDTPPSTSNTIQHSHKIIFESLLNGQELKDSIEESLVALAALIGSFSLKDPKKQKSRASIVSPMSLDSLVSRAQHWQRDLLKMQETLEDWMNFQTLRTEMRWIFAMPDVQKQLPMEVRTLFVVEEWWQKLLASVSGEPLARPALLREDRRDDLKRRHMQMEKLQVNLEELMNMKRQACPRLAFLTDSDLMEMMRQAHQQVGRVGSLRLSERPGPLQLSRTARSSSKRMLSASDADYDGFEGRASVQKAPRTAASFRSQHPSTAADGSPCTELQGGEDVGGEKENAEVEKETKETKHRFLNLSLYRCFDGIDKLALEHGGKGGFAMCSPEGELVEFSRVRPYPQLEEYISHVEESMTKAVNSQMSRALLSRGSSMTNVDLELLTPLTHTGVQEATKAATSASKQNGGENCSNTEAAFMVWLLDSDKCSQAVLLAE
ncbi:unnamed protein product, partial [Polarella glacialis]